MRPVCRTLVVDDEAIARAHLVALLETDPEISVIGQCRNGLAAVAAIRAETPDLVLLDIQMPELDGFGVVSAIGVERMPAVIFVTAYDEHALKAFEVHAVDYLLKPVNPSRLAQAVGRVKRDVARSYHKMPDAELSAWFAEERQARLSAMRPVGVKVDGRILLLHPDQIDWVEADDDHVLIHVGKLVHEAREPLSRLAARLPPASFLRIHRSRLVNTTRIREIQPWFNGDYVIITVDGTRLNSGKTYRDAIRSFLASAL
ncbi:MAG: response regulator transcription factor [Anaerolineae bacterium]|nr:response regulator transcription factor [Gemmatimonadaceae bacterium]